MSVGEDELARRAEDWGVAPRLSALGCAALTSVITGKLDLGTATESLQYFRRYLLDKDGDLLSPRAREEWLRSRGFWAE